MRGRDGRIYPIAISEVDVDGEVYNADDSKLPGERVTTLLGRDPGWNVLDHQSGIARFEEPLGGGQKAFVDAAAVSGLRIPNAVDGEALRYISMAPGRRATVVRSPPMSATPLIDEKPTRSGNAAFASDPIEEYEPVLPTGPAHAGGTAAMNGVGLVVNAAYGATVAANLDDGTLRAWEAVFEENDDGRLRSRLMSYEVKSSDHGLVLHGWHNYVGDEGKLMKISASYYNHGELAGGTTVRDGIAANGPASPTQPYNEIRPMFPR